MNIQNLPNFKLHKSIRKNLLPDSILNIESKIRNVEAGRMQDLFQRLFCNTSTVQWETIFNRSKIPDHFYIISTTNLRLESLQELQDFKVLLENKICELCKQHKTLNLELEFFIKDLVNSIDQMDIVEFSNLITNPPSFLAESEHIKMEWLDFQNESLKYVNPLLKKLSFEDFILGLIAWVAENFDILDKNKKIPIKEFKRYFERIKSALISNNLNRVVDLISNPPSEFTETILKQNFWFILQNKTQINVLKDYLLAHPKQNLDALITEPQNNKEDIEIILRSIETFSENIINSDCTHLIINYQIGQFMNFGPLHQLGSGGLLLLDPKLDLETLNQLPLGGHGSSLECYLDYHFDESKLSNILGNPLVITKSTFMDFVANYVKNSFLYDTSSKLLDCIFTLDKDVEPSKKFSTEALRKLAGRKTKKDLSYNI